MGMQDYDELTRWQLLKPDPHHNPRPLQPEYKEGKKAYAAGKQRRSNPYAKHLVAYELWLEGWEAARERYRRFGKGK